MQSTRRHTLMIAVAALMGTTACDQTPHPTAIEADPAFALTAAPLVIQSLDEGRAQTGSISGES